MSEIPIEFLSADIKPLKVKSKLYTSPPKDENKTIDGIMDLDLELENEAEYKAQPPVYRRQKTSISGDGNKMTEDENTPRLGVNYYISLQLNTVRNEPTEFFVGLGWWYCDKPSKDEEEDEDDINLRNKSDFKQIHFQLEQLSLKLRDQRIVLGEVTYIDDKENRRRSIAKRPIKMGKQELMSLLVDFNKRFVKNNDNIIESRETSTGNPSFSSMVNAKLIATKLVKKCNQRRNTMINLSNVLQEQQKTKRKTNYLLTGNAFIGTDSNQKERLEARLEKKRCLKTLDSILNLTSFPPPMLCIVIGPRDGRHNANSMTNRRRALLEKHKAFRIGKFYLYRPDNKSHQVF